MTKVTKKITKKLPAITKAVEEVEQISQVPSPKVEERAEQDEKFGPKVKKCPFCHNRTLPAYTDVATIRRFLSDRAKIVSRLRSGVCSKHQRTLSKQIKYARHLNMLPFTPKI